mmetsp:Transcript_68636/g.128032  ORF Transcript_68636/g.128032 Transcript_68636/m.128032 type:complete len:238 (-) Transcript_68636:20-733(-)
MAKSIRSKIKKRFRTAKRQRVDAMLVKPLTQEKHEALKRVIEGRSVTLARPKNAFKYPDAAGAVFPQHEVMKPIDFRSQNLPMAGYAFRGNRRKYTDPSEVALMQDIAKNSHPEMEVLAGGGAVLATTGQRVSKQEAALLATQAERPEAAAVAMMNQAKEAAAATPEASMPLASQAPGAMDVEVKVSGGDDDASDEGQDDAPEPENAVDHTRRPVVKETTRRDATKRPRKGGKRKST